MLGTFLFAQQPKLSSLGPKGGVITHLTGSLNDDVIFAVVRENGLYRSIDGGESWNKVTSQNFKNLTIGEITLHPRSSDTVMMATTMGLYRSTDKGFSWMLQSAFPYPTFSIKYSLANPSIMFGTDFNGVLRSNDAGKTWLPLKDNVYFGNRTAFKVAVHPSDINNIRVIVSTGFADSVGLFFSPDGGQSWKPFNKNLPTGAARRIYAMEIDTTGIGTINFRAVIGTADGMFGVQSDYADTAWQAIKKNNIPISGVITDGVLVYDKFDPTAGQNGEHKFSFFVASNASEYNGRPMPSTVQHGLFKIDSRLNSIISISPFSQPPITKVFDGLSDIMSIFVPYGKDKGKIYMGTTAGVFISNDTGNTWQHKNDGIFQTLIRNLVSVHQTPTVIPVFAGIFGGGVVRSNDEGLTWNPVNLGLTNPYVTALAVDHKKDYLYAGTAYTMYRSTNYGVLWAPVFTVDSSTIINKQEFTTGKNEMTIRISSKNPDFLLLHTKAFGLRLSTNGGSSWSLVSSPFPVDTTHVPEHFEFDPIDSLTIYYAGYGLHKSTNLGQTWIDISGNLPKSVFVPTASRNLVLTTISPTINPKNNKEILLPSVFDEQKSGPYRIFKTINGGTIWDSLIVPAYDVIYDSFDDKKLIATGPYGVFGSEDGGLSWKNFSDSLQASWYTLINAHATNQNIFYIGSENGAHKLEFTGSPSLKIDTTDYYFGSLLAGKDSIQTILMSNKNGTRKVTVQFSMLTDSVTFRYPGPRQFEILPGDEVKLPVRFVSLLSGSHTAKLIFVSNDNLLPEIVFNLFGHTFTRDAFDKFVFDFGSVTVGKDSVLNIPIDNSEGIKSLGISYLGKVGDTISFSYLSAISLTVDSGKSATVAIKFAPRTVGEKTAYIRFSTTDARFPLIQYRLKGVGVAKNFMSRKILIDSSVGFSTSSGVNIADYYKILTLSLRRADIAVQYQKSGSFESYNALVYVQPDAPPPSEMVDSLQRYVNNGGTLVLVGDYGAKGNQHLTTFLEDSGWSKKYNSKTGIRFNTDLLLDSMFTNPDNAGIVIAKPFKSHLYTYSVDSVVMFLPGSLSVDTSLRYVEPLLTAKSKTLFSVNLSDTSAKAISNAYIAAVSKIGKGKIIALSDYDIWWNGIPDDTTKPLGVFGGKNLQFAFNIFGLVDNLLALLEPTPQEAYEMISIPYAFTDSSVEALFKDLGKPNKLLWRMFGHYDQRTGYAEFPDDFKTVRRGEGYWLIAKNPVSMNLGTTTVQATEEDFEIVLHPGYNMIGNPFPYKVSWKNSFRSDSVENVIWSYHDGKYDSITQNMDAYHGYWVKNRGKLPKIIRINSLLVTENSNIPKKQDWHDELLQNEWKLQLSARTAKTADDKNFIGVLNTSVDGLDENDFSEPPTAPEHSISISIKNTEGRLAADYRAFNAEGNFWDIEVISSEPNIPVSILLSKFGAIKPDFKTYLLDNKQERVYDMSNSNEYSLKLEKNEKIRSFRLIVGSQNFVEKNTNGIPIIPLAYALSQNYPNPFNPTTSIQYSVSHSGMVMLEIFNVLGQKVKTVVNGFKPIGSYIVQWDGNDNLHKSVASGIYYYRLKVNEFSSVKKMTFIK